MEDMPTRFPKEPQDTGKYFDVANRPTVASRWVMFTTNGHPMQAFYRGQCLYCGCSTWTMADGTTMDFMGQHALRVVFDPEDNTEYIACNNCGGSSGAADLIVRQAREQRKVGKDVSPIEWPAKHPMHKMASL